MGAVQLLSHCISWRLLMHVCGMEAVCGCYFNACHAVRGVVRAVCEAAGALSKALCIARRHYALPAAAVPTQLHSFVLNQCGCVGAGQLCVRLAAQQCHPVLSVGFALQHHEALSFLVSAEALFCLCSFWAIVALFSQHAPSLGLAGDACSC